MDGITIDDRSFGALKTYQVSQDPALIVHQAVSSDGGHLMIVKRPSHLETNTDVEAHLKLELWNISMGGPPFMKSSGSIFMESGLHSTPRVVFSDDLRIVLISDQLYRISLDGGPLSITAVHGRIPAEDNPDTVRWVVRHDELLFLARVDTTFFDQCREDDVSLERNIQQGAPDTNTNKSFSLCKLCLREHSPPGLYVCDICYVPDDRIEICRGCVCQGLWCRDTTHILTAKSNYNRTLSWRNTHTLSKIDLRNDANTSTETSLFSTRIGRSIESCPTVNKDTEQLLWFIDATHILACDYKTGNNSFHAVRNVDPEHVTYIYAACISSYLFSFSIEKRDSAIIIRSDSFRIIDSGTKRIVQLERFWTNEARLPAIQKSSKVAISTPTSVLGARMACYIAASGQIVYQPLPCRIIFRKGQELPGSLPSARPNVVTIVKSPVRTQNASTWRHLFEIPSSLSCKYATTYYFPGHTDELGTRRGTSVVLLALPELNQLPVKVDLDLPNDQSQPCDSPMEPLDESFTVHEKRQRKEQVEKRLVQEPEKEQMTSSIGHYTLRRGTLCRACSGVLGDSSLLNTSDHWEPTSIRKLDGFFHGTGSKKSSENSKLIPGRSVFRVNAVSDDTEDNNEGTLQESDICALEDRRGTNQQTTQSHGYHEYQELTGADINSDVHQRFLYEHHAHHPSLVEFAKAILDGCHLCSLFLDGLGDGQQGVVQDLLNAHGRGVFGMTTDHNQTDSKLKVPEANYANVKALLSSRNDIKWERCSTNLVLRIKTSAHGKTANLKLCLYKYLDGDDIKPAFRARIRMGVPDKYQNGNQGSSASLQQQDNLKWFEDPITDPMRYTGSPLAMDSCRRWLRQCCSSHSCVPPGITSLPPTRVIDVGSPDGNRPPHLYITSAVKDAGMMYLTLSHCWGRNNSFETLTTDNLERWTQGFHLETLPQTFRDAVLICRSLNVRYLWIDSMCIIQKGDNLEDWRREAPKMAAVYSNSLCTLAALSSTSMSSGCFAVRNSLRYEPLLLRSKEEGGLNFLAPRRVYGASGGAKTAEKVHHLNSRGWVFQERMLSPRTLGFSSDGISWECDDLHATDIYPQGIKQKDFFSSTDFMGKHHFKELTMPLLRPLIDSTYRASFLVAWYELVEEYSKLGLTNASDKLIAVAGIAQVIQKATRFEWYHGLWYDASDPQMFLSQLLWTSPHPRHYDESSVGGPINTNAPSFSWASIGSQADHRITFHARFINLNATSDGDSRRNYYWLPLVKQQDGGQYSFVECISQFGVMDVHEAPKNTLKKHLNDPSEKMLLDFRTEVLHLGEPFDVDKQSVDSMLPPLILRGHVRDVTLVRADTRQNLWKYPWAEEQENSSGKDDGNDDLSPFSKTAWFFPDSCPCNIRDGTSVKCLTIARWQRSWDERWFCAGIVLVSTKFSAHITIGGVTESTRIFTRVGYFEHSWKSRSSDWENDGERKLIPLI
ncbi:hypothetical protein PFICI_13503 [Pestalotiopsis fici W106-1]|uniref:Heterokaryon incompatibility domain-containing protein n=1 Tax=Pestalotiopsis fici (strain W106-1 / CGMCC3.15140) TaxID=1229662 RepID=W3WMM9_PESFW|nr:uncharacterized protein PFICI_13503 [Pestalotiopsis fici W106-1]ETS75019.1 hypothetical protein PFICI_13503 [Pestalotiopsis fici W106-1]